MLMLYVTVVLVFFVTSSCAAECGEKCTSNGTVPGFYTGICRGILGEEISIPCGGLENTGIRFNYINQTAKTALLLNSTECLRLTLTAFHNDQTIICNPSTSQTGAGYIYKLLVEYSPRLLGYEDSTLASLGFTYSAVCPLKANPSPICTWRYYLCDTDKSISISKEQLSLSGDGNCSFAIRTLNLTFIKICYECVASNYLGTSNFSISIPFNYTSACQAEKSIMVSPKSIEVHKMVSPKSIEVHKGSNLTLSCTIYGVSQPDEQHWDFESDDGHQETYVGENHQHNITTCRQNGDLVFFNMSVNQSGNYTCVFSNSNLESSIQVKVIELALSPGRNKTNVVPIVVGSTVGLVVLLSVVGIAAVLVRYKLQGSGQREFTYLYHTDYDGEEEYDVFLSFAEEDKLAAELAIKEPLEKCGYSVCWHHDAFLPGYTIEDNMERSIFRSRYTIALISEAFLASEFCLTELNITKRKMHETSKNTLIPVLTNEKCNVPPDILSITYVNIGDAALIDRLKAKIGKPL